MGVGLTQVNVDVDKPWSDNAPFGIDTPNLGGGADTTDPRYDGIPYEHVGGLVETARGVEDPSTLYQHLRHADDFSLRLAPTPGSGHAAVFAS